VLAKISQGRPVKDIETVCSRKRRDDVPVQLTIAPIRDAEAR
jgi:hypothetical protein